ncbi:winged helix-turn-helix transcriptional regulator [Alicyclobacillus acidiphilus]|uniref:winged helix-turn-helix transcriptional regulator n=1 Tax=Alicyclobacillus acidiphilus TaxID=182455 RepID=UPI0008376728|nr:winged helix-turn-helix transcriptional regulator [Alicyclobacillus acidiphilus]
MQELDFEQIPVEFREFLKPMIGRDALDQKIIDVMAAKSDVGGIARLSQYYIAEIVGATQPMVSKHIKQLIKRGFIRLVEQIQMAQGYISAFAPRTKSE